MWIRTRNHELLNMNFVEKVTTRERYKGERDEDGNPILKQTDVLGVAAGKEVVLVSVAGGPTHHELLSATIHALSEGLEKNASLVDLRAGKIKIEHTEAEEPEDVGADVL